MDDVSSNRLLHCSNSTFGDITWDEAKGVWTGEVKFAKRMVRVILSSTRPNQTPEERLAVIERSHNQLLDLERREPKLRQEAARQYERSVRAQMGSDVRLPFTKWAKGLELAIISLHGCGELHYRNHTVIQSGVTVCFGEDLSFDSVQVYNIDSLGGLDAVGSS